MTADTRAYLSDLIKSLHACRPRNRCVNVVCHGQHAGHRNSF